MPKFVLYLKLKSTIFFMVLFFSYTTQKTSTYLSMEEEQATTGALVTAMVKGSLMRSLTSLTEKLKAVRTLK